MSSVTHLLAAGSSLFGVTCSGVWRCLFIRICGGGVYADDSLILISVDRYANSTLCTLSRPLFLRMAFIVLTVTSASPFDLKQ